MAKYIIVYEIDDYPEMGGGKDIEIFDTENEMHDRVNELAVRNNKLRIIIAGFLQFGFEYKPIEIIKEYKPKRKQ